MMCLSENLLSDHKPIFFSLSLRRLLRKKHLVTSRNIRHIDPDKFQSELKDIRSIVLADCLEEELVKKYNDSMQQLLDRHAPLKTRCVTVCHSAPWINIPEAKWEQHHAERTAYCTKLTIHKEIFVKQRKPFTMLQKETTSVISYESACPVHSCTPSLMIL